MALDGASPGRNHLRRPQSSGLPRGVTEYCIQLGFHAWEVASRAGKCSERARADFLNIYEWAPIEAIFMVL